MEEEEEVDCVVTRDDIRYQIFIYTQQNCLTFTEHHTSITLTIAPYDWVMVMGCDCDYHL